MHHFKIILELKILPPLAVSQPPELQGFIVSHSKELSVEIIHFISTATVLTMQNQIVPQLGLLNEILCILVAQDAAKQPVVLKF